MEVPLDEIVEHLTGETLPDLRPVDHEELLAGRSRLLTTLLCFDLHFLLRPSRFRVRFSGAHGRAFLNGARFEAAVGKALHASPHIHRSEHGTPDSKPRNDVAHGSKKLPFSLQ